YLVQDMFASGFLQSLAYVQGVGAASRETPRDNLTGDPYFTDGLRAVMFVANQPVPTDQVTLIHWGQPLPEDSPTALRFNHPSMTRRLHVRRASRASPEENPPRSFAFAHGLDPGGAPRFHGSSFHRSGGPNVALDAYY